MMGYYLKRLGLSLAVSLLVMEAGGVELSLNQQVMSQYVGVAGISSHEDSVLWTTLHSQGRGGWFAGAFYSSDLGDLVQGRLSSNRGDEVDWYGGWKGEVWDGWSLKMQLVYLDFIDLLAGQKGDMLRLMVEGEKTFTLEAQKWTPYGGIWFNKAAMGVKPERRNHFLLGLRHRLDLAPDLALAQQMELRRDDGFASLIPATLYRHEAALAWKINDTLTLKPAILQFSSPLTTTGQRQNQWVLGAGYGVRF